MGRFALPRLLKRGYSVTAVSRAAEKMTAGLTGEVGWTTLKGIAEALDDDQLPYQLLSCGPVALADEILRICTASGFRFRSAVVVSTSSVWVKSDSSDSAERMQMEQISAVEGRLIDQATRYGIDLALLRPTLIYGCGLDQNISRVYRWLRRFGRFPVAGQAQGRRQPLHADDLAEVAVALLERQWNGLLESAVCGGTTLSYQEMIDRVAHAAGRRRGAFPVAPAFLAGLAGLMDRVLPGHHSRRAMVRRQAADLVFDDSTIRTLTQSTARPFRPDSTDFRLPT